MVNVISPHKTIFNELYRLRRLKWSERVPAATTTTTKTTMKCTTINS